MYFKFHVGNISSILDLFQSSGTICREMRFGIMKFCIGFMEENTCLKSSAFILLSSAELI